MNDPTTPDPQPEEPLAAVRRNLLDVRAFLDLATAANDAAIAAWDAHDDDRRTIGIRGVERARLALGRRA